MSQQETLPIAAIAGLPLVVVCIWAVFTQSKVLEQRQKQLQNLNSSQVCVPYSLYYRNIRSS